MNQNQTFDYIEEAHVTCSNSYHGDRVPLEYFAEVVKDAIEALTKLDAIKKTMFYGREAGVPKPTNEHAATLARLPDWLAKKQGDAAQAEAVNIIHGIIGKATEAGELLEALAATAIDGEEFDQVNAVEEVGDGFWYDAILLRALNSNFGSAQVININKLRARFPNAFTEFDANNRNLDEERKILSEGVDSAE